MACTLSNKCAKNLSKQTVLLQLIIKNVVTCFFWNTVYICVPFSSYLTLNRGHSKSSKLVSFESSGTTVYYSHSIVAMELSYIVCEI